QSWVDIDKIGRTNEICFRGVGGPGKKRIKSPEAWTSGVVITARDVRVQRDAGRPRNLLERVACFACPRPSSDIALAERPELVDQFHVPVPSLGLPPETRADRMAEFARGALIKGRRIALKPQVIKIDRKTRDEAHGSGGVETPQGLMLIPLIVECARIGFHG